MGFNGTFEYETPSPVQADCENGISSWHMDDTQIVPQRCAMLAYACSINPEFWSGLHRIFKGMLDVLPIFVSVGIDP